MLEREVLISELFSVDGFSTSAVVVGEVSTLAHEVGNDTVERTSLVAESLLTGAKSPEVLRSLGDNIFTKLHGDAPYGLSISANIEIHLGGHFGFRSVVSALSLKMTRGQRSVGIDGI